MPVAICKRALRAGSVSDESLHRRCAGEGAGDGEFEGDSESNGDFDQVENNVSDGDGNDDNADIENNQIASNSPRQNCILAMGLMQLPDWGLCDSLSDAPPSTSDPVPLINSAPDAHPLPPPSPPQPAPAPAPTPAPIRKPVPVNAGGPGRAIPKRIIEGRGLPGMSASSPDS